MTAQPQDQMMSVAEYLAFDRQQTEERYEYIDGAIRMMSGGTINHATIASNVWTALRHRLRGGTCRPHNADVRVKISETRYVYPDVSVSCDPQDRGINDSVQTPRLIVEVLSPSNEARDRGRKADWYRECSSIEEYVLIDSRRHTVQIQRRAGSLWNILAFNGLDASVELDSLGLTIPMTEIYEDVELEPAGDEI